MQRRQYIGRYSACTPLRTLAVSAHRHRVLTPESEAGVTLLETLIMLAVTALVMMIVIPFSSEGVRDSFRLADDAVILEEQATSEAAYRRTLRMAAKPLRQPDGSVDDIGLAGNAVSVRFPIEAEAENACFGHAGYDVVRLKIENTGMKGGQLLCDSTASSRQLLAWPTGTASFAYSDDGKIWSDVWPTRQPSSRGVQSSNAPYVRLVISDGSRSKLIWVDRAGMPDLEEGDEEPPRRLAEGSA